MRSCLSAESDQIRESVRRFNDTLRRDTTAEEVRLQGRDFEGWFSSRFATDIVSIVVFVGHSRAISVFSRC